MHCVSCPTWINLTWHSELAPAGHFAWGGAEKSDNFWHLWTKKFLKTKCFMSNYPILARCPLQNVWHDNMLPLLCSHCDSAVNSSLFPGLMKRTVADAVDGDRLSPWWICTFSALALTLRLAGSVLRHSSHVTSASNRRLHTLFLSCQPYHKLTALFTIWYFNVVWMNLIEKDWGVQLRPIKVKNTWEPNI